MKKTKAKTQSAIAEATATTAPQEMATQSQLIDSPTTVKPTLRDDVEALLTDRPIYVNSIAAAVLGVGQGAVLREMQQARTGLLRFYKSESGGKHSPEEAVKLVNGPGTEEAIEEDVQQVLSTSVDQLSWYELERLYNHLPKFTKTVWQLIQQEASKELESGHRMAATVEAGDWQQVPWQRAQFLAIRNGFVNDWQPKGAIELSMIDMLAQAYSEYLFWSEEVHRRSSTEAKILTNREEQRLAGARGHWLPPRVDEQNAIEHAMQMLDRYNRLYVRTLRQLRDLRRYSTPVTINNPQQVNIAAEGGQQVNAVKMEL